MDCPGVLLHWSLKDLLNCYLVLISDLFFIFLSIYKYIARKISKINYKHKELHLEFYILVCYKYCMKQCVFITDFKL